MLQAQTKDPGALPGAAEGQIEATAKPLHPYQCRTRDRVASLRLVELRNDDGHLIGWIPLGEAVAAAIANFVEAAR